MSLHTTHGQTPPCRKRDKFLLFPHFSQVPRACFQPAQRALHTHKGTVCLTAAVSSWDSTCACGCSVHPAALRHDPMWGHQHAQNPAAYSPAHSSKGNLPHLVGQVSVQVSSWLSCSSRGDAQSPPSMPQREQDHHKGPLSAETFLQKMCWFGRPLSYSWAILFDAMDCLHVSVSKRELHFVFLSTILSFPYSVPWPCLGVLSQNTRRCQGKFSPWWKSCQA